MCTRPSVPRKGRVLLLSGAAIKGVNCSRAESALVENGTKATRSNTRRYRGVSIAEFYSKSDHRGCPIQALLGWGFLFRWVQLDSQINPRLVFSLLTNKIPTQAELGWGTLENICGHPPI